MNTLTRPLVLRTFPVKHRIHALGFKSILIAGLAFAPIAALAANTPIVVSGFNRDVVIESGAAGPPYSSAAQEFNPGEGTCFYQAGLSGKTRGLPATGLFTNPVSTAVYQFQPFTANNALVMSSETATTNGILFITAPRIYDSISILANSGNGNSTGTAGLTLHFNDGTTFVTNYFAPDWFNNNGTANYSVALSNVERIVISSGSVSGGGSGGGRNPRFYETSISLATVLGGGNKPLSSIAFGQAVGTAGGGLSGATGVYAFSGTTNASQTILTFTAATVTNLPANGITTTSATLNGRVLATGNDAPFITIYYGTVNGGNNPAAWQNSISAGWQTGSFAQGISGLAFSTTYYFTARAVNAGGTNWASPPASFITLTPSPATVTNLPASSITANSASLNGQVLATGGDTPTVTIYYGQSNGGTNPAAWANNAAVGLSSGAFLRGVFGLSSNTTYYYSAQAVNGGGTTWGTPVQSFTTLLTNPPVPPAAVLTQHNDNGRTGRNLFETQLNTSTVNSNSFGLVGVRMVDDQIYAQPLVMTNVSLPGHGSHNVVYICSVNDSVYAYDADDPTVVAPYWQTNFLWSANGTNVVAPRNGDMTGACGGFYRDYSGAFGIAATPVIDPVAGTIYLLVRTKEITATTTNYVQRLHALNIATGAERANSPMTIAATFPGTASDGNGTTVTFDPYMQNQRAGLLLVNGIIYIAWTSHCDWTPYHGWVMAYDATSLQQLAVYNDTPNGSQGGIWMSGHGPAADASGNVYVSTANGTTDTSGTVNRAESFLKLSLSGTNLTIASWFTPYDYANLNNGDLDLGSGGVLLIPGTSLMFSGGKGGVAYLVNKDNMGGLSGGGADTNIIQSFTVTTDEIHGGPVWWDGPTGSYAYIWPSSVYLQQYLFNTGSGTFQLPAFAQDPTIAAPGQPGGVLAVSANGSTAGSGIVWSCNQLVGDANQALRAGILHAYDAGNVANELWNSQQVISRDDVGIFAKFVAPTVANGKVYVATFSGRMNVYGILGSAPPVIFQQPQSITRYTGDNAKFSVWAGDSIVPISYQWYFGGSSILGATSSTLVVSDAQFNQVGSYSCAVSNQYGGTVSSNATLSLVSASTVTYPEVVIADSPVAYWRLDETNGTVAHDYLGGNNGVYTNAQLGVAGYNALDPDTAAGFGGVSAQNSYVGNLAGIDFATAGMATFSVEAWVNGNTQVNGAGIIAKGTGGGGEQFNLDTGSGTDSFRFFIRDDGGNTHLANGNVAPNGAWHHLVGVCDEANNLVALYVDGALNASTTGTGGALSTTIPMSIGSRRSGQSTPYDLNFVGTIDEAAVYNYALSLAQVQLHYQVGTNGPVVVTAQSIGGNVVLSWPLGALQAAPVLSGPYTNVPGATSPLTNPPSSGMLFYRVKVK